MYEDKARNISERKNTNKNKNPKVTKKSRFVFTPKFLDKLYNFKITKFFSTNEGSETKVIKGNIETIPIISIIATKVRKNNNR